MSADRRAQLARLDVTIRALELERRCLAFEIAAFDLIRRRAAARRSHRRYDAPKVPASRGARHPAGARRRLSSSAGAGTTPAGKAVPGPRMTASPRQPFHDTSAQPR